MACAGCARRKAAIVKVARQASAAIVRLAGKMKRVQCPACGVPKFQGTACRYCREVRD